MVDIAKLGFSVNTKDLDKGKAALDALVPAAQRASAASVALEKANLAQAKSALATAQATDGATKADIAAAASLVKKTNAALAAARADLAQSNAAAAASTENRRLAAAVEAAATGSLNQGNAARAAAAGTTAQGNAAVVAAGKLDRLGAAANDNINRLQSTPGNIAAQFQDIGVTAAGGMNPLLIALQQGTQLSAAMQGGVGDLKKALQQVFSATTIGTVAIVALVAGLIQLAIGFFSSSDAADEAAIKFVDLTSATAMQSASQRDLIAALEDYDKMQARSNDGARYSIALALEAAQAKRILAIETRKLLQAELEAVQQKQSSAAYAGNINGNLALAGVFAEESAIRARIKANNDELDRLNSSIVNRQIEIGRINADVSVDPSRKIAENYKDAVAYAERIARANNGMVFGAPIADVLKSLARGRAFDEATLRQQSRTSGTRGTESGSAAIGEVKTVLREIFGQGTTFADNAKHGKFTSSGKVSDHWGPNARAIDFVPEGGIGKYSGAQMKQMIEADGRINIRRNSNGTEQFFGPGMGAKTKGDHSDHGHVAWAGGVDADKGADRIADAAQRQADAIKKAQDATDSYVTSAASGISSIAARWDDQPKLIDQISADTRALDDEMGRISKRMKEDKTLTDDQRASLTDMLAEATRVRALVADGMSRPLREVLEGNIANQSDMQTQIDLIGKYGYELAYATEMANLLKSATARGMTPDAIAKAMPKFMDAASGTADKSVIFAKRSFDENLIKQIEMENFALERQRGEIGLSEQALMAYRYETEVLTDAKRQGVTLTESEIAAIRAASAEYAAQTLELAKLNEVLNFKRDVLRDVFTDFYQGIRRGDSLWKSFSDAALSAVDKIINKIISSGIDKLIDDLFDSTSNGGGGILAAIKSIFTGVSAANDNQPVVKYAKGDAFTNSVVSSPTLFKFAKGGAMGMMGEAGPEAIMPLKRGADGSLGVQVHGGRDSQPQNVNVTVRTTKYLEAEIDQRASNIATPMAVQSAFAGAEMAGQRITKSRRNAIP